MPKRGDDVAPPGVAREWVLGYADQDAVQRWEDLKRQFRSGLRDAWEALRHKPEVQDTVQKFLKGPLGRRVLGGRELPQWQRDVASGSRIWYVIDNERRKIIVTLCKTGHPGATDAGRGRGKRTSRTR